VNDDLYFAGIAALNAKLRSREISAEELAKAFLARLRSIGPRFNALSLLLEKPALRAAKEVDGDLKRERFRGPLQGIPYAVKDLLSVAKHPTTWGAKPFAEQVFDTDATVVQRLSRASAVLIGKLAMIELAGGGGYRYPSASLTGATGNPWNPQHWAGGSSSGSAAAVAAGLVPFAIGSETSGSILTPAAYSGVTGLRPTYGLVSRHGAMPLSWTLDKIGPLAHSAEDCALVLQAIAGADRNDPATAGKGFRWLPQFARPVNGLRVGFAPVDFESWAEEPLRPVYREALNAVKSLNVDFTEVELPDLPYGETIATIVSAEGSSIFQPLIEDGRIDQLADAPQIAGLKAGLEIPARDYLRAMRVRHVMQEEIRKLFSKVDVFLSYTRNRTASRLDEPLDRGRTGTPPAGSTPKTRGLSRLIPAANLAGLPAISLPCGFVDGLPVALQVVGRPFSESTLVAFGVAFQQATNWHLRKPPAAA
jgi:aspartyl-tRNA(Asn)/glutamyl-tRNA(Gln) amidotransferase subunit A